MQVSAQNSLTWLQTTPAAVAAADQISSAYGQVSPSDDASGAESGQAAISGLQSPSQMFAPASLNSLLSTQTDTDSGAASASGATTPTHHHHHHGGGAPPTSSTDDSSTTTDAAGAPVATTATATGAASSDTSDTLTQALSDILSNL